VQQNRQRDDILLKGEVRVGRLSFKKWRSSMPYKRNDGKWVGQVRRKGVRKERKFDTKKEATDWEVQQWKITDDNWGINSAITLLTDWTDDYLDFAKSKHSTKTYKEKRVAFNRLFEVLDPATPVASLSKGQVLDFLQSQYQARSGYAANKDRKNLVAAWNWGIKYRGFPTVNPCMVDRFPEKRQIRHVPPEKDFWTVYDVATEQDKVMLLAYLHLAARRCELFKMKWEDVNFDEGKVRLWTRKRTGGNLECEWIPMTDDLCQALIQQRQYNLTHWVFLNPKTAKPYSLRQRWMIQLCKKASVKPFGIHAIRHLTASILAQSNTPMILIREILRHKNLATTERYIRRLEDLRPALRVLSRQKSRPIEPSINTERPAKIESAV
jgi:integrase